MEMRLTNHQWIEQVRTYALNQYGYDITEAEEDYVFVRRWRTQSNTPQQVVKDYAKEFNLVTFDTWNYY
jgi:GTP cyclohydrolase II